MNLFVAIIFAFLAGILIGGLIMWLRTQILLEREKSHARLSEEKLARIAELEAKLKDQSANTETIMAQNIAWQKKIAELEARNEEEKKHGNEKIALLNAAKDVLKDQFRALAADILDEKGKKFSVYNRESLHTILSPLTEQLKGFKAKIHEVYMSETRERASLRNELENLKQLNQQLNQEAVNLTQALRGDKKKLGNWGELVLERVLEQSGLRKDAEYRVQEGFRNGENRLLKPDVIVYLPENKNIVIDSKVSLYAYEQYFSANTEKEQEKALEEHVQVIRNHIKILSEKDYTHLKGIQSLDFVLMFIPIEPAFMVAFQHDATLFSDAFERRIVIVTPTTLLATLKTIRHIWQYERQNQNTLTIAEKAGVIYDKIRGFTEGIEKLGKQLDTAQATYHDVAKKLIYGKGNLVGQAQSLVNLGVEVKKEMAASLLQESTKKSN